MSASRPRRLPASQVLVTIGTPCTMSAVGSTETYRQIVTGARGAIAFAACDAGLAAVDVARSRADAPVFIARGGGDDGRVLSIDDIDARWGRALRAQMGIRALPSGRTAAHVLGDIAAPLPHDLQAGGLRRLAGLTCADVRQSALRDMFGLFDDDPRLGPSLQSLLFLYGGLGALAALPLPLATLVPDPFRFLVAAGCNLPGHDSFESLSLGMQPRHETVSDKASDKLAHRLASSFATHGPSLIVAMLAPALSLSRVRRRPELLGQLEQRGSPLRRVPPAPLVVNSACASALAALCHAAPHMLLAYPGHVPPPLVLWTAADAALEPDARILEGFGLDAIMTTAKLAGLNRGRPPEEQRSLAECLAPFDVDAHGTVVGNAGSGLVVSTLEFALRNFLDVTSIVVGWGQSAEAGGKAHFAGVGFGGENAIIEAFQMAYDGHGYGVADFDHYAAHATGTRANSRSDLTVALTARRAAAAAQGHRGALPRMTVSAHKALGDGHSMGETSLKATGEAIQYVLGQPAVGVPTLHRVDSSLGEALAHFVLSAKPCPGNPDGGALVAAQGFGGFNAAILLQSATPEALARYRVDARLLDAYRERRTAIREERIEREAAYRRTRGFVLRLAEEHRWVAPSA